MTTKFKNSSQFCLEITMVLSPVVVVEFDLKEKNFNFFVFLTGLRL